MFVKIVNKDTLLKEYLEGNILKRKDIFIFSKSPVYPNAIFPKKFSIFLFCFGVSIFLATLFFQYWANAVSNPQILSAKPYFHILTAVPFSFEISLLFIGIVLFIRFLIVNYAINKQIPDKVKAHLKDLADDAVLIISEKDFLNLENCKTDENS